MGTNEFIMQIERVIEEASRSLKARRRRRSRVSATSNIGGSRCRWMYLLRVFTRHFLPIGEGSHDINHRVCDRARLLQERKMAGVLEPNDSLCGRVNLLKVLGCEIRGRQLVVTAEQEDDRAIKVIAESSQILRHDLVKHVVDAECSACALHLIENILQVVRRRREHKSEEPSPQVGVGISDYSVVFIQPLAHCNHFGQILA